VRIGEIVEVTESVMTYGGRIASPGERGEVIAIWAPGGEPVGYNVRFADGSVAPMLVPSQIRPVDE
jgi:hypothetical protein